MKKLITISLIFISGLSFGQNLWKPTSGSLVSNVKFSEGVQITDTTLLKGITIMTDTLKLTKGITVGSFLYVVDASGKIGYAINSSDSSFWKPGAGSNSLMDKRSATGSGVSGTTIGYMAINTALNGLAVGYGAENLSIGLAIGEFAVNGGTNGIALGNGTSCPHTNSIAFGLNAETTVANQLMISDSIFQVMFRNVTKLNAPSLPSDSTAVGTKDFWVDTNGFIRRKF